MCTFVLNKASNIKDNMFHRHFVSVKQGEGVMKGYFNNEEANKKTFTKVLTLYSANINCYIFKRGNAA